MIDVGMSGMITGGLAALQCRAQGSEDGTGSFGSTGGTLTGGAHGRDACAVVARYPGMPAEPLCLNPG